MSTLKVNKIVDSTGKDYLTIQSIARSLNVKDSQVVYSTDTATVLNPASGTQVLYIHNAITQVTYGVPVLSTTGETIVSVSDSELTTSTAEVYTLETINKSGVIFETIADIDSGNSIGGPVTLLIGDTVIANDYATGNGAGVLFFKVVAGGTGTDDGGQYIDLSSGLQLKQNMKLSPSIKDFGAVGDRVSDDTLAIQNALWMNGKDSSTTTIDTRRNIEIVVPPSYGYLITSPVYQPAGVTVHGFSRPSHRTLLNEDAIGSFILARLTDVNQCAWNISGYTVSTGERLNAYKGNVDSSGYNNGYVTRNAGCAIYDVAFMSDNFTKCAIGIAAASATSVRVSVLNFCNAICSTSNWDLEIDIHSLTYHTGVTDFNSNGVRVKGYISSTSNESSPVLDATTAPSGLYVYNVQDSIKYATTGFSSSYNASVVFDAFVVEGFERGRLITNSIVTDNSSYNEALGVIPFHIVSSNVVINAPQLLNTSSSGGYLGSFLLSSNANVLVNLPQTNRLLLDFDEYSESESSVLSVHYTSSNDVPSDQKFSSMLSFQFDTGGDTIYVASSGDDSLTGLSRGSAVQTITTAISRANFYGVKNIEVLDGDVVTMTGNSPVTNSEITIYASTSATVNVTLSASYMGIGLSNASITFKNIFLVIDGVFSGTGTTSGVLRCSGSCSVVFLGGGISNISTETRLALFAPTQDARAIVNFSTDNTTVVDLTTWSQAGYASSAIYKIIAQTDHTATWPSNFSVL